MGSSDLRAQLETIHEKHGKLTPELVVQEARKKDHPLHTVFEWDNKKAADRWRRHQAHELIQSVRIKYSTGDGKEADVRAFHAVRAPEGGYVYEAAEKIAEDPLLRSLLLREMERDFRTMRSRYAHMNEFFELLTAELDAA